MHLEKLHGRDLAFGSSEAASRPRPQVVRGARPFLAIRHSSPNGAPLLLGFVGAEGGILLAFASAAALTAAAVPLLLASPGLQRLDGREERGGWPVNAVRTRWRVAGPTAAAREGLVAGSCRSAAGYGHGSPSTPAATEDAAPCSVIRGADQVIKPSTPAVAPRSATCRRRSLGSGPSRGTALPAGNGVFADEHG